jgi:hypothetical protein
MGLEFDGFLTPKFPSLSQSPFLHLRPKYIETQLCVNCFKTLYLSHQLLHESLEKGRDKPKPKDT